MPALAGEPDIAAALLDRRAIEDVFRRLGVGLIANVSHW
jgi:hypothetical protein